MDLTVELFCGDEKPFSHIAKALGYSIFTVDVDPASKPDLSGEICESLAKDIPNNPFIIWAAPPFNQVFREKDSWEPDGSLYPRTPEAEAAIQLVRNTISLLSALRPTWWFVEHPRSLVRKMPLFSGFNRGYPTRNRYTIEHSAYGPYRKAESDIWTNAFWWIPRPSASQTTKDGSSKMRGRVPPPVYADMFEQLESYQKARKSRGELIPPTPDQIN